jgi:hypothetical protein
MGKSDQRYHPRFPNIYFEVFSLYKIFQRITKPEPDRAVYWWKLRIDMIVEDATRLEGKWDIIQGSWVASPGLKSQVGASNPANGSECKVDILEI